MALDYLTASIVRADKREREMVWEENGEAHSSLPKKFQPSRKIELQRIGTSSSPTATAIVAATTATKYNRATSDVRTKSSSSKKKAGSRLWMRFDRMGQSELLEYDKNAIIDRVSIPARDLRILGPIFSHSSNILAREKAMVVNLEFIKAIVTAEEVLLLDPLSQEVIPFVDQLRQKLPLKRSIQFQEHSSPAEMQQKETLPFEFRVLEMALEVVCSYLDSSVADVELQTYPLLDVLTRNVSTKNLERVRSLKSNLTHLLARVQKVRDEIEHLLDDDEDMAQLYLTRKQIQHRQFEALVAARASNSPINSTPNLQPVVSKNQSSSMITGIRSDDNDVEELEMLLEAYFMQLDGTRNKILAAVYIKTAVANLLPN